MKNLGLTGRASAALLSIGLICSGCGPATKLPDPAQQATISGKVTLDGTKPVAVDSNVVFYCSEKGATVAGKVDSQGTYSVRAGDPSIGIPVGRYQVMVRPPEAAPVQIGTEDYKKQMMGGGAATVEVKSDIPERFRAFDTSQIVLEIKPGANSVDLDLSKL